MSSHHNDKATFLERLIFNNRPAVIVICLLVSIFLFWQATLIRPSTSFEKMIPLKPTGKPVNAKRPFHKMAHFRKAVWIFLNLGTLNQLKEIKEILKADYFFGPEKIDRFGDGRRCESFFAQSI